MARAPGCFKGKAQDHRLAGPLCAKKMSSATGGRAPLLTREEGSSLAVGTTPGEARPWVAGGGDPLADHARTGGVVVMHRHNVPAAKPKLSVKTPIWAPGQPLGGLLQPFHRAIWSRIPMPPSAGRSISTFDQWAIFVEAVDKVTRARAASAIPTNQGQRLAKPSVG
jgi:hypothetical protein